jgi:hypothetical protein
MANKAVPLRFNLKQKQPACFSTLHVDTVVTAATASVLPTAITQNNEGAAYADRSAVRTVGALHMVQSAQKCLARATPDSSTRCSKNPGYLSAPFNFVVKHIIILSPKL